MMKMGVLGDGTPFFEWTDTFWRRVETERWLAIMDINEKMDISMKK